MSDSDLQRGFPDKHMKMQCSLEINIMKESRLAQNKLRWVKPLEKVFCCLLCSSSYQLSLNLHKISISAVAGIPPHITSYDHIYIDIWLRDSAFPWWQMISTLSHCNFHWFLWYFPWRGTVARSGWESQENVEQRPRQPSALTWQQFYWSNITDLSHQTLHCHHLHHHHHPHRTGEMEVKLSNMKTWIYF